MKLCYSFLFFIILVTMVTPVFIDHSKCSIEYIRDIVANACSRVEDYPRRTRAADDPPAEPAAASDSKKESIEVVLADVRKQIAALNLGVQTNITFGDDDGRPKRGVDDHYDKYFKYCCEHMNWCEKLDCPH